jgi:predicted DNA-binding transcriptional regulator YafY
MLPVNNQDVDNFIVFGSVNTFRYTNYKGEVGMRKVIPLCLRFNHLGSSEKFYKDQWVLECFDLDKNDYRTFALKDIHTR